MATAVVLASLTACSEPARESEAGAQAPHVPPTQVSRRELPAGAAVQTVPGNSEAGPIRAAALQTTIQVAAATDSSDPRVSANGQASQRQARERERGGEAASSARVRHAADLPAQSEVDSAAYLESLYVELQSRPAMVQRDAVHALEDIDPAIRADGAWQADAEGPALEPLLLAVADDPDPQVRIAALASLENSNTFATLSAVVSALQDENDDVVLAAIDSLEFAGDVTNVRDLQRLEWHPNPEVAEAAMNAIEFLRL